LYPQYSTTTTASIQDVVDAWRPSAPEIAVEVIQEYCEDAGWVAAIADSIRAHWQTHGRSEKLMFSFHGLPQRVANAGDPYPQQCERSAQAIVAALGLGADEWQMGYQSRFGAERWLQPYAEPTLWKLAEGGVRSFDLICPGFATDCLETLEEVALGFAETLAERGAALSYIPCLNASDAHARALAAVARRA
ncbi:ferrochelatase, partial [Xanthomonas fragariae]